MFPAIVLDVQQSWAMFWRYFINNYGWCCLDTMQQINSYLLNKHYDGLMKSGKIEKQ
jgi:preprotein translocase subunit SecY